MLSNCAGPSSRVTPVRKRCTAASGTSPKVRTAYSRSTSFDGCIKRFANSPSEVNDFQIIKFKEQLAQYTEKNKAFASLMNKLEEAKDITPEQEVELKKLIKKFIGMFNKGTVVYK